MTNNIGISKINIYNILISYTNCLLFILVRTYAVMNESSVCCELSVNKYTTFLNISFYFYAPQNCVLYIYTFLIHLFKRCKLFANVEYRTPCKQSSNSVHQFQCTLHGGSSFIFSCLKDPWKKSLKSIITCNLFQRLFVEWSDWRGLFV